MVFLPFIQALITIILLMFFIKLPTLALWLGAAAFIANIVAGYFLVKGKTRSLIKDQAGGWWNFCLLPLLVMGLGGAYLTIVSGWQIFVLCGLMVLFIYVYWRLVYFYCLAPNRYVSFSLENLSFYSSFILVWLLGAAVYGWRALLSLSILLLGGLVAAALILIIYQLAWVTKTTNNRAYWLVGWLIMLELFLIILTLPLDHYLLGFIWASVYYLVISLFNDRLRVKLTKSRIRLYLVLIAVCWLLLLVTARWL